MAFNFNKIPARTIDFFVHPAIAPDSSFVVANKTISFLDASNLNSSALHGSRALAAVVWVILLFAALITLITRGITSGKTSQALWAISIFLLGQYGLHLIYGDSPFLYSAQFLPPMIMLIGFVLSDSNAAWLKWITRALILLFIGIAFPLNIQAFLNAIQSVNGLAHLN